MIEMTGFDLKIDMNGEARTTVSQDNTAVKYGSGSVDVFATPAMVALMEEAAINTVDSRLPRGYATVGTAVDVKHIAATPMGMNVTARAVLTEINGSKLLFKVEAFDEQEKIGEGIHRRFIIRVDSFREKAAGKSGRI
jgi:fluoroacetyl-CoA thioesterase